MAQQIAIDTDIAVCNHSAVFHIGDVIRKLRITRGLKIEDVAAKAFMSKTTISELERGLGNQRKDTIEKVAIALGTTSGELYAAATMGMKQEILKKHAEAAGALTEADPIDDDVTDYKREDIPVIQEGEASPEGLVWDGEGTPIAHLPRMSRPYDFRESGAYAIVLRGDSMEPVLQRGMRLILSVIQPVHDGDVVYAQLRSGERLAKIARRQNGGWLLISANPAYPPRYVSHEEVLHIHKVAYVRMLK